jgi:hypothetical protein
MQNFTLKQFKVMNPDLKYKKLIPCEHIQLGELDKVVANFYAGPNTRMLLCPVCVKVWIGHIIEFHPFLRQLFSNADYVNWLQGAGKETRDENTAQ